MNPTPSQLLPLYRQALREMIASHHATNPRIFGSVARGEDTVDSDLDILIDTTDETTLSDIGAIQREASSLLRIPVSIVTSGGISGRFKQIILKEAMPL